MGVYSCGTVAVIIALSELCMLADIFDGEVGKLVRWIRREGTGIKG